MITAIVGQPGKAVVKMFNAAGEETDNYDKTTSIEWTVTDPAVMEVVDEDAEPKDAEFRFKAASASPQKVHVRFDGDPGDGVREIKLESDDIMVEEPGDGGATTATLEITLTPVA